MSSFGGCWVGRRKVLYHVLYDGALGKEELDTLSNYFG